MLIGYVRNENKILRYIRKICWTILCGYADPKKMPRSEYDWWRIGGDPEIIRLSPAETKAIADKFRATKWTLKSP